METTKDIKLTQSEIKLVIAVLDTTLEVFKDIPYKRNIRKLINQLFANLDSDQYTREAHMDNKAYLSNDGKVYTTELTSKNLKKHLIYSSVILFLSFIPFSVGFALGNPKGFLVGIGMLTFGFAYRLFVKFNIWWKNG